MKTALICGASGQDGAYLSKLLLDKGYKVFGGSRDAQSAKFQNLIKLDILEHVELISISVIDFRSVLQVVMKIKPDEIYNLAGQSSVALSFEQPIETMESISLGTLNLLEAIRFSGFDIKLYSAGSSECFGNASSAVNEDTPFRPRSPYGVSKATAFWQVANYREAYKLFACTGILFNHESPLRNNRFVSKKIVSTACRIAAGSDEKLTLGNIDIYRDWGWAPEYVNAMWLMLQEKEPTDYVIATGETMSLKNFVKTTFETLNLNVEDYVIFNKNLMRPNDITKGLANPSKAKSFLKWEATIKSQKLVKRLIDCELNNTYI
jgi:GDPmannose 4,6-dehydratase